MPEQRGFAVRRDHHSSSMGSCPRIEWRIASVTTKTSSVCISDLFGDCVRNPESESSSKIHGRTLHKRSRSAIIERDFCFAFLVTMRLASRNILFSTLLLCYVLLAVGGEALHLLPAFHGHCCTSLLPDKLRVSSSTHCHAHGHCCHGHHHPPKRQSNGDNETGKSPSAPTRPRELPILQVLCTGQVSFRSRRRMSDWN